MESIKELICVTTRFLNVVHSYRGIGFETEVDPQAIASVSPDRLFIAKVEFPDRAATFFGSSRGEVVEAAKNAIDWFKALEKARSSHPGFDGLPL
jgi:hypothetical protein